jgi:RNase P subunit RPR2
MRMVCPNCRSDLQGPVRAAIPALAGTGVKMDVWRCTCGFEQYVSTEES